MIDQILERFREIARDKKNWLKILIGGVLLWIPVVNAISLGYLIELLPAAGKEPSRELPEWENPSRFFLLGLPLALVSLAVILLGYFLFPFLGLGKLVWLGFSFIAPIIGVVVGKRMLETSDWNAALQVGIIIDSVKKYFKPMLPLLLAHLILMILCSGIGLICFWSTICFLDQVCFFGFGISYFYTLVVILPLAAEMMTVDQEMSSVEDKVQEASEPAEASDSADDSEADATQKMPPQETPPES